MKEPMQMKSSKSKNPDKVNLIPQFVSAVYIDSEGKHRITYNLMGGFPKQEVLPALVEIAKHYKENLLDHFDPSDEQQRAMDALIELAEQPPETDEDRPERDNVILFDPKPTEEA